jgi:hypothetical protein
MTTSELIGELLEPQAADLAEALRAFGYAVPTALADLIDNSIAASARNVRVEYSSDPGSAWLAVVDDGRNMDGAGLRSAMRLAADPAGRRAASDLGRFGLGLKTASLSQARKLTVLSRGSDGALAGMTWDRDHISQHQEWRVIAHADPEALQIAEDLGFSRQGTMVLWRNTDRLGDGATLRRRVTDAGKQLSLLFHRFSAIGRQGGGVGPAASALSISARAFRLSLDPLIPPLRNARRETGLPAAASSRATMRARSIPVPLGSLAPLQRVLVRVPGPGPCRGMVAGGVVSPSVRSGTGMVWSSEGLAGDRGVAGPVVLVPGCLAVASSRSMWASAVPMARTRTGRQDTMVVMGPRRAGLTGLD